MVWSPLSYTPGLRRSLSDFSALRSGRWSLSLPGADGRARARARGAVGGVLRPWPRVDAWTRAVDRSFVVPGANAEEACVSLASKYEFLRALLLNATELELSPIQKFLRLSPYAYAKGSTSTHDTTRRPDCMVPRAPRVQIRHARSTRAR